MKNEKFQTLLVPFDDQWIDNEGLIGNAYTWAEEHLPVGHRAIGYRLLSFNGELNIYTFDFRHSKEFGITLEAQTPAKTATVIRVNSRQMVIIEVNSGTVVAKYLKFTSPQGPVWRLWIKRTYSYHVEDTLPAVAYMIFMLQCNRAVKDVSKFINRDWLTDMRDRHSLNLYGETPEVATELLAILQERLDAWFEEREEPTTKEYSEFYHELLEYSSKYFIDRNLV